jgi:general secretion pathway protein K
MNLLKKRGAVLILVLWTIALATLLVSTIASEVRLSAKAVFYHRAGVNNRAKLLKAVQYALFEIMLQRMPTEEEDKQKDKKESNNGLVLTEAEYPLLRFNGQILEMSHQMPEGVKVRIYDHAGMLNIRRLTAPQWRDLFKQKLGEDNPEKLDSLTQCWEDWIDTDDLSRLNGAEKDYYLTLDPPYEPRNGAPETVEELRLIKGFDELFKDIDLFSVFTIYGALSGVNPNYATAETLLMIPGLNEENVEKIMGLRKMQEIKSNAELQDYILPNDLQKATPWFHYVKSGSNFYTIAIQMESDAKPVLNVNKKVEKDAKEKEPEKEAKPKKEYGYLITVESKGYALPPRILRIDPQGILPSTRFDDAQPPKKLTGSFSDSKSTPTSNNQNTQSQNPSNPLLSIPINK